MTATSFENKSIHVFVAFFVFKPVHACTKKNHLKTGKTQYKPAIMAQMCIVKTSKLEENTM